MLNEINDLAGQHEVSILYAQTILDGNSNDGGRGVVLDDHLLFFIDFLMPFEKS